MNVRKSSLKVTAGRCGACFQNCRQVRCIWSELPAGAVHVVRTAGRCGACGENSRQVRCMQSDRRQVRSALLQGHSMQFFVLFLF